MTTEKERMVLGYCSWVEAGLTAVDIVSWRSKISVSNLHTEKWK